MSIVKVSSKYQISIPKEIREALNIRPGKYLQALPYKGRIELIPIRDLSKMRGCLKGIDTKIDREKDRL